MPEKVLLKDVLFHKAKVSYLADRVHRIWPAFDKSKFVKDVVRRFPELELKARITWMAECLRKHLPETYPDAVMILVQSLPEPNDPGRSDDDFGDFIFAPYSEFVARYGCNKEHISFSLKALHAMTQRFSAEDAIRYFINAYPEVTYKALLQWSRDGHYHVRRLASEGTRPKLPWSQKITQPVNRALPILDQLYADSTRYVTRSVANHINDIAKADPDLAVDTLARWRASQKQHPAEMDYIIRHGLRTLIKTGHPRAMELMGIPLEPDIRISRFRLPKEVVMDTALEFSFTVESMTDARLIVDYVLHFQNKSGALKSRKVFKLKTYPARQGDKTQISKRHMMREHMTTRTLYPGRHRLDIQINGKVVVGKEFLMKS